ncbi:MAG: oxidoreductase [Deltaproteobacteria bacterium]|jgi:UDP-N-acetyl-2-amino-2-deoxyglucuronate dehydrogenase|nr:oxidoreductase [Deltaproteobacteria bacterium]
MLPKNFAIVGVAGFVAPRHLKAIHDTGNRLVAAADPHDSVGILDRYAFEAKFFTEIERFDRHLEKLRRGPAEGRLHYLSICTPNYLHDAHIRLALRVGADVICEKPLVINPWNLDALRELEAETGRRVSTILQLRVHPALIALRAKLLAERGKGRHDVCLTYITARGGWYHVSWKGAAERSGGLATNIGIHFFDLLIWLFGSVEGCEVHLNDPNRVAGRLELEHASVRWALSVDRSDLPFPAELGRKTTFRSITVDGQEIEFTEGFADLHTKVYEETLAGRGFGIEDARPSIVLAHRLRTTPVSSPSGACHPLFKGKS